MGTCATFESDTNKKINRDLKSLRKNRKVRVLLLGAGDSGKSTFLRQMKILHLGGFDNMEHERGRKILRSNVVEAFRAAFECGAEVLLKDDPLFSQCMTMLEGEHELTNHMADLITQLWKNPKFKKFVEDELIFKSCFEVPFLFENAKKISDEYFQPTNELILHARMKTTGIQEVEFKVTDSSIVMVDVGGQRSERRKWLNCFQEVTAVIFIVALDEYDLTLSEDIHQNRLEESLQLFHEISSNQFLQNKKFILFLNKYDIFKEKIKKVPLSKYCKEFPSNLDSDLHQATYFISSLYEKKFAQEHQFLSVHTTCVLDTNNCQRVFDSLMEHLSNISLIQSGVL